MKKSKMMLLASLVLMMPVMQQCIGSFALTKKVYAFNQGMGSKFVNEAVFLALNIIPVYSVAVSIDAFILNTIEFWTGANPMAMNDTDVKKERFVTDKGAVDVTVTKNQIVFAEVGGESFRLNFAPDEVSWYLTTAEGTHKFIQFDLSGAEPKTIVFSPEGRSVAFNMGERDVKHIMNTLNATGFALAN